MTGNLCLKVRLQHKYKFGLKITNLSADIGGKKSFFSKLDILAPGR